METKWLEDFVSLAETRSFSRSAQLRHVTKPAFSRRIQALEAWAGTDLVDRSSYPTRLTPAGQTLNGQALEILAALQAARNLMRSHRGGAMDLIEFAVPHTLAFTFFPHWLTSLRPGFGPVRSRLTALNVHDAVLRLTDGGCDLLIAYHHASLPLQLSPERYELLSLGQETLAAYSQPDAQGGPRHVLAADGPPVPLLAYASGAYMGHMVEQILRKLPAPPALEVAYETDMAEGLKAMALQGHGLAFLPASLVRNELAARRLVPASPPGVAELTMEVRIYRERPELARHAKPQAQALWAHLAQAAPKP